MNKKRFLKTIALTLIAVLLVSSLAGCMVPHSIISDYENEEAPEIDEPMDPQGKTAETLDYGEAGATEEQKAAEQQAFAEFIDKNYKESIEDSYFATHILYINPEAAGIDMNNVTVAFDTIPDDAEFQKRRDEIKEIAEVFRKFNRALLTPEQQVEYDSFKWELTISKLMTDEKFDYYDQYFAPPDSLEARLVSNLSNWDIRNEADAKNIVALLDSLPGFVDSAIVYAKEQQKRELFMTDFDAVVEGAQDVLDMGMDSVVLSYILDGIDKLEIDQAAKDGYKAETTRAFQDSYLPSFQKIIDGMEEMRGGYNNTEGFAAFPNGSAYYEVNLMLATGTLDSVKTTNHYLKEKSEALLDALFDVYAEYPEDVNAYYSDDVSGTGFKDYNEILEFNKTALLADHPEVKNLNYHIEDANAEEKLAEKNIAAYFLIPPLDGERLQQMRVEPSGKDIDSLDTFTTVSHEGFPGHMYHFAYMYENINSSYIKTLGIDSFVEGYAVYAQNEAMNYLDSLSPGIKELMRLSTAMSYADYSIADIGINYYGWSKDDVLDYFTEVGYSLADEDAQEIYDYLRCSPCSYVPYGYGYIRIQDMKERAEAELGDKFNLLAFNTALIEPGAVPFDIIEARIAKYIEAQK